MGCSPWGCTESDMPEATEHARRHHINASPHASALVGERVKYKRALAKSTCQEEGGRTHGTEFLGILLGSCLPGKKN